MNPSSSSSSSSSSAQTPIWVYSYVKLRFFNRIRRFLRSKTPKKPYVSPTESIAISPNITPTSNEAIHVAEPDCDCTGGIGGGADEFAVALRRTVKKLHFGSWEEKEIAAKVIVNMAKEDVKVKKLMVELRVVPALVSMVTSDAVGRPEVAVEALLELAKGSFENKALMVEAGILHKLPSNIQAMDESAKHDFARLLLSLSSLINSHFTIALQANESVIPFLLGILELTSNFETQRCCLETLYNISTVLENVGPLVSNGVVQTLLKMSSSKGLSDRALAALGNLVVTSQGKRAMESSPMVPDSLIEIMTWEDKPKSIELSAYILMILAHQSSEQREKMAKSGIVAVLLEVGLLGSPLAQKRALKLLQWFKNEKQAKMYPHSGPQTGRIVIGSPVNQREVQEGRKMMKNLVKQSLYKNLELITGRASAGDSAKLKNLVISTSSKSLPF
ncbi:U-box domain-containing protein 7-like [Cucurbita pepo subsp. pepo]|uniref:U-box domain-containing protein 7-like n=1 Tax=Cucurbita pepo subsp. pepo TaxID=3664 RepID=UPI000C9D63B4|nr:U-box domain-containing protein 7-like [Cucurbita pepo subsp. pepo]